MRKKLSDPWKSVPAEQKWKFQSWIPASEKLFLLGIDPNHGTMQYTINNLLKGLIDECRASGITSYDHIDRFIEVVARRSAPSVAVNYAGTKAEVGNDGRGLPNVAEKVAKRPNLRADAPKRGAERGRGEEGKKGKGGAG